MSAVKTFVSRLILHYVHRKIMRFVYKTNAKLFSQMLENIFFAFLQFYQWLAIEDVVLIRLSVCVHLGTKMTWLHFEVKRSVVKVAARPNMVK